MGTFKENSRTSYTEEKVTHDGIRTGSLQRIADACELMAKDRAKMEQDLKWYKDRYEARGKTIESMEAQIKGLKSAKSRFKNQIEALKNKEA